MTRGRERRLGAVSAAALATLCCADSLFHLSFCERWSRWDYHWCAGVQGSGLGWSCQGFGNTAQQRMGATLACPHPNHCACSFCWHGKYFCASYKGEPLQQERLSAIPQTAPQSLGLGHLQEYGRRELKFLRVRWKQALSRFSGEQCQALSELGFVGYLA